MGQRKQAGAAGSEEEETQAGWPGRKTGRICVKCVSTNQRKLVDRNSLYL